MLLIEVVELTVSRVLPETGANDLIQFTEDDESNVEGGDNN